MVSFLPLNLCDEDSITNVLIQIDNAIQYGEDLDVREMKVNIKCCQLSYYIVLFYLFINVLNKDTQDVGQFWRA